MKTYNIPVSWKLATSIEIEANSLNEAISKARQSPLPVDGEYVEDSFEVDEDFIIEEDI